MLPEYLVYITAFRFFERGYGTTIGVGLFIFVLSFSLFQVRYMYIAGSGEVQRGLKRGKRR
jgi:ABC-type sugar transport system permease subunit